MFKVEIETLNAAFGGEGLGIELAARLVELAKRVGNMSREEFVAMSNRGLRFKIMDSNGNTVGFARATEIEDDDQG